MRHTIGCLERADRWLAFWCSAATAYSADEWPRAWFGRPTQKSSLPADRWTRRRNTAGCMVERRWRSTATATTSLATSRGSGRLSSSTRRVRFRPYGRDPYRVARAAIAAGAHYIDLADDGAFVAGIGALDEEAKAAGVAVISGASSVPAISGGSAGRAGAGTGGGRGGGVGDPARQPRAARPVADAHHRRPGRQTASRVARRSLERDAGVGRHQAFHPAGRGRRAAYRQDGQRHRRARSHAVSPALRRPLGIVPRRAGIALHASRPLGARPARAIWPGPFDRAVGAAAQMVRRQARTFRFRPRRHGGLCDRPRPAGAGSGAAMDADRGGGRRTAGSTDSGPASCAAADRRRGHAPQERARRWGC